MTGRPAGARRSGVSLLEALALGLAVGASVGFVAVVLTPLVRRWGGVTDRDLINGATVVGLSLGLWLVCGVLFWVLAPRTQRPVAGAVAAAGVIGGVAIVAIYAGIGPAPLTPYPTRFASLAVPLIALVVVGGAALFPLAQRLSIFVQRSAAVGGLVAAVIAGGIVYSTDRQGAVHYTLTSARAAGKVSAAAASPAALSGAATPTPSVLHFTMAPDSEVSYTVNEKLANLPAPDDAIGKTQTLSGDIWLTPQGLDVAHASSVTVDLRTLKSDQARRDQSILTNTLQTATYPTAVYTIQQITGFPTTYQPGTTVAVTLNGTFALHGQQQQLSWTGSAVYNGTQLEVVMSTQFDMTSFGISPPNTAAVQAKSTVKLDAHLYATQQPG